MTSIEVVAWLGSTLLLKGSAIAIGVMVAAKFARSAAGASLRLGMGYAVLGTLVLLGPLLPEVNAGFTTITHVAVEGPTIGGLTLSPALGLVMTWAVGVIVMLSRLTNDVRAARRLCRRAGEGWQRAEELLRAAGSAVGCERLPGIRQTSELATVALIGFWRPVLLIPTQAREWSDEEFFGILCHELEHVRRNDWLMLMVERIVGAVFWINPLIHFVTRSSAGLREMAADDAALRAGAAAPAYARRLIAVARELHNAPRLAVSVAFAEGGRVDERVKALFDRRDRRPSARSSMIRALAIALPVVMVLAALEPWTCLP